MKTMYGSATGDVAAISESREASYETALRVATDLVTDSATAPRIVRVEVEDLGTREQVLFGRVSTVPAGGIVRVYRA